MNKHLLIILMGFGLVSCGSSMTLDEKIDKAHQSILEEMQI